MRRYPAEWEPQSGVQLTWPHRHSDWAPRLQEVEPVFIAIAREVCRRERLLVVCHDAQHQAHVQGLLQAAGVEPDRIQFFIQPSNDTWARDHGPISILDAGTPRLLDFVFNGWGSKHAAQLDDAISAALQRMGAFANTPLESLDFVLEGGSLESDGAGTLLTTSQCLLSPARNAALSQAEIEALLKQTLGLQRILWLQHGHLEGDDTDSHIDTLARFADPATIIYVACNDTNDSHYEDLQRMEQELKAMRRLNGEAYRLLPLPWPRPIHDQDGQRLPASYANFLIINGAVLVPTYRDPADAQALAVIRGAFPAHEVIGIDCLPLIYQYGSLHCVTMNYLDGIL